MANSHCGKKLRKISIQGPMLSRTILYTPLDAAGGCVWVSVFTCITLWKWQKCKVAKFVNDTNEVTESQREWAKTPRRKLGKLAADEIQGKNVHNNKYWKDHLKCCLGLKNYCGTSVLSSLNGSLVNCDQLMCKINMFPGRQTQPAIRKLSKLLSFWISFPGTKALSQIMPKWHVGNRTAVSDAFWHNLLETNKEFYCWSMQRS